MSIRRGSRRDGVVFFFSQAVGAYVNIPRGPLPEEPSLSASTVDCLRMSIDPDGVRLARNHYRHQCGPAPSFQFFFRLPPLRKKRFGCAGLIATASYPRMFSRFKAIPGGRIGIPSSFRLLVACARLCSCLVHQPVRRLCQWPLGT